MLFDPENFTKISWFEIGLEVNKSRAFFIKGTQLGVVRFYGPYALHSHHRREMKNIKGNVFMHYAEDFYFLKEYKEK